ncbi:MAG TPA: GatB/YqeY domain-containing protein [Gammaproteobacteria bacterium]|nr:GatB/YqeY domain-containing protein [Gammaproteobacteria bacterium]
MASLKERLNADMKDAMRAGDKDRLAAIRLIQAAIKQREVDELPPERRAQGFDDAQVIATLEKMIKQRRESIEQYRAGNREDLAAKEQFEIDVIRTYLPEPLSDAELAALIDAAIAASGARSIKDMGKVMAIVKEKAAGRADMAAVGAKVKSRLSS